MTLSLPSLAISILSGLYTASWGAFKDSPYEGFNRKTFPRSIFFSIGVLVVLCTVPGLKERALSLNGFQLFLLLMGVERMLTEVYKACFRNNDQSIFLIPQRMTLLGQPVDNELLRQATGMAMFAGVLGVLFLTSRIEGFFGFVITGFITGLFISASGAYKDAPFEGFNGRKFFRSALVLTAMSPIMYALGPAELGFLVYVYGGLERLLVEHYKSFVVLSVPGKFRTDLERHEGVLIERRYLFNVTAKIILAAVALLYAAALFKLPLPL